MTKVVAMRCYLEVTDDDVLSREHNVLEDMNCRQKIVNNISSSSGSPKLL